MSTNLLSTTDYRKNLGTVLSHASSSVSVVSAYITKPGADWIVQHLHEEVSCRVITRWRLDDLVSGASDLEVFETLQGKGIELYLRPDLHGKVFLIDERELFVGSANLTLSGLGLSPGGNFELGSRLVAAPKDIAMIDELFDAAVRIDADKFVALKNAFESIVSELPKPGPMPVWPQSIYEILRPDTTKIWVSELPWTASPQSLYDETVHSVNRDHDLLLLGINANQTADTASIANAFERIKAWRWLERQLQTAPNNTSYFGRLSSALHNALLEDPKPYRTDVKILVSNLITWAADSLPERIVLDRPNYSQRIRLVR